MAPSPTPPAPPRIILTLEALISGVVLLSALAGVVLMIFHRPPTLFIPMFELVVVVACVFGVLAGMGRFSSAPALAMLITGGAILVGALLSEPSLVLKLAGRGGSPAEINGVSLLPFALARVGAGVALLLLSAITVLIRDPRRSMGYLVRAAAFGVPLVLVLAFAASGRGRALLAGLTPGVTFGVSVVAFFVLGGLFCASAHCLIRAFEVGVVKPIDAAPTKAA